MKRLIYCLLVLSLCLSSVTLVGASSRDYQELRGLVERTQSDLQQASGLEHGDKQRGRYQHAQDNLSKFDRKLVRGKFDKGALNDSVGAIKSILDHNTLQPSGRDALMRDLSDLRGARERRY